MTREEMTKFIKHENPITFNSVKVEFIDGGFNVGFFIPDEVDWNNENKWRFVPNNNAVKFQESKSLEHSIIIEGNKVVRLILL